MESKFNLGQVVVTASINALMEDDIQFQTDIRKSLDRYCQCDWGITESEDWKSNDYAIKHEERILAAYETCKGKVWIITEWDRSVTTVLFPSEY